MSRRETGKRGAGKVGKWKSIDRCRQRKSERCVVGATTNNKQTTTTITDRKREQHVGETAVVLANCTGIARRRVAHRRRRIAHRCHHRRPATVHQSILILIKDRKSVNYVGSGVVVVDPNFG